MTSPSPRPASRFASLDGLRGVAALVVVIHHAFLVSPLFAAANYGSDLGGEGIRFWMSYSPIHLVWAGSEAVVIFFVLSGFVLARAVQSPRFDWFAYFPSRMLRLYLPVAGAVLVGFLILLLPHDGATESRWLTVRPDGYPFDDMLLDLTIVGGTSGTISPLWTLRWEVIFSLLLPVAIYLARFIPAWLYGVICLALSTLGSWQQVVALQYLPIFGLGIAISGEWDRITAWGDRVSKRVGAISWPIAVVGALLIMSSYWWLALPLGRPNARPLSQALILIGSAILIVAAVRYGPLRRLLSWRPVAWLGAVSFSLYLIHEPVLIFIAHLTDSARWTLVIGIPLALLVAWGFYLLIERPAHRLSRKVRDSAAAWEASNRASNTARGASAG